MKNIVDKITTLRIASASSVIQMAPETVQRVKENDLPKKDVLLNARVAAVMAAKKTSELIPYCHPIPLDSIDVDFVVESDRIRVLATVTAIWKTGVEMEALTAAAVGALTIYDMLKPIDKEMEVVETKLVSKKGGKTDFIENIPKNFQAAVLVSSDSVYQKKAEDKSGKIIQEKLNQIGIQNIALVILPDEKEAIQKQLLEFCKNGLDLVITTGGTGLGPRDVTVEATQEIIEREMPAVVSAMQSYGQMRTPYAMLSRAKAGVRGRTVIVNLPGSSSGARECMNAIFPALMHVYRMMRGERHLYPKDL